MKRIHPVRIVFKDGVLVIPDPALGPKDGAEVVVSMIPKLRVFKARENQP